MAAFDHDLNGNTFRNCRVTARDIGSALYSDTVVSEIGGMLSRSPFACH